MDHFPCVGPVWPWPAVSFALVGWLVAHRAPDPEYTGAGLAWPGLAWSDTTGERMGAQHHHHLHQDRIITTNIDAFKYYRKH